MGDIEDYKLRRIVNDYMKEICHYSQKQVFANSTYQRNYFQSQIDEAIEGMIKFLQLYYNGDHRRQKIDWEQDIRIRLDQQFEDDAVSHRNIRDNLGNQPVNQPGVRGTQSEMQPEIQPEIPPEIQPEVRPEIQPEIPPEIQPEVQHEIQPETQSEIQPEIPAEAPGTQPETTNGTGEQRQFTIEELSQFDGRDQRPAYVAVNGVVYDVSNVARWAGGAHFGLVAGRDHTRNFMGCHLGITDRLQKLPVVGVLVPS